MSWTTQYTSSGGSSSSSSARPEEVAARPPWQVKHPSWARSSFGSHPFHPASSSDAGANSADRFPIAFADEPFISRHSTTKADAGEEGVSAMVGLLVAQGVPPTARVSGDRGRGGGDRDERRFRRKGGAVWRPPAGILFASDPFSVFPPAASSRTHVRDFALRGGLRSCCSGTGGRRP